LEQNKTGST